ncbi:uncharacterized protein LOC128213131 isoform X1 [Mya arenaria]|uniref:uncharacterized protein LOC128213131 isoform X1 n=1 Tax=Mya arenaria TaxID=6604 RepID=UPI0022E16F82|nr:uncharacterized protein LOC128213131 isoform X1 [Mya arenaria]
MADVLIKALNIVIQVLVCLILVTLTIKIWSMPDKGKTDCDSEDFSSAHAGAEKQEQIQTEKYITDITTMMTSEQLFFLFTIFQASKWNDVETRLEILEKQMKEVLEREAQTKRENEQQNNALHDMKTVVDELQATVKSQQSTIVKLQDTVSEQVDRIEELEIDISRRQPPEIKVAFSAVKSATQSGIDSNENILFEKVIINQGNGFNSQNGVFIAPQTGIYMIVTSLFKKIAPVFAQVEIIHDGNIVAVMNGIQREQFSQTVIIAVNAGEEIYLRCSTFSSDCFFGDRSSTFSGFLLWQL